jgi:predicted SAM-dependent methyltransferase
MKRVIVGAGGTTQEGWISLEESQLDIRRFTAWINQFLPGSCDAILAEHVLEHMSPFEAGLAIRNFYIFLKRGGHVRLAVPDGFHPMGNYIDWVRPGGIWNPHSHKTLFDYKSLSALLERIGFRVRLLEWHDEAGELHSEKWDGRDGEISRCSNSFYSRWFLSPVGGANYTSLIVDAIKQ